MKQTPNVTVEYLYSGLPDYWSGDGRRWDDNRACLFASYNPRTTLRDMVDEWLADDGDMDGKAAFEAVDRETLKAAILESLTDKGRADYASGALAEWAEQLDPEDYREDGDYGELPQVILLVTVETE